jgi:hypothetical protein
LSHTNTTTTACNTPQRTTTHPPPNQEAGMHNKQQTQTTHPHTPVHTGHTQAGRSDARVHYPDLKQQPHTTPTRPHRSTQARPGPDSSHRSPNQPLHHPGQARAPQQRGRLIPQNPNSVSADNHTPAPRTPRQKPQQGPPGTGEHGWFVSTSPNSTSRHHTTRTGTAPGPGDDRCACSLERR